MTTNAQPATWRSLLLEAALVSVVGLGVALLVNQISPRGLVLTRDYFGARAPATPIATDARPDPARAIQREGLRVVRLEEVLRWRADPGWAQGRIVLVDARAEGPYREGHIPGAIQFDHFYPASRLGEVLAVCSLADYVVVYCSGGECTDSLLAARLLRDAGIPAERISVFVGGIHEWRAGGSPVEAGDRDSGRLQPP